MRAGGILGSALALVGLGNATQGGLSARQWIIAGTDGTLDALDFGHLDTAAGEVAFTDPLVVIDGFAEFAIDVPTTGARLVAFVDRDTGENSKLALIFSDGAVTGGQDVSTILVDAGTATIVTPKSFAALDAFTRGFEGNRYTDYFARFDADYGRPKWVPLPGETTLPWIGTGGDGGFPVFTLTDARNAVVALYADFRGRDAEGNWLLPPGLTDAEF